MQTADSSETASASHIDELMSQHEADPPQQHEPEPPNASQSQVPTKTERKRRVKWHKATETGVRQDFEYELEMIQNQPYKDQQKRNSNPRHT